VRHYGLKIAYDPGTKVLSGRMLVLARATQNLKSFNLDLRPFLEVSEVNVNGRRARYTREGEHELVIRPKGKLRKGRPFLVSVRYEGVAEAITDPDGSIEGWIPTADGAFVVNEPQGSPGWYAVNDTPTDKATYDFAVTVPEGKTVVANGRLTGTWTRDGKTTWLWRESDPMAPYLFTATQRHLPDRLRRHPARRHADLQRRRSADPPVRATAPNPALAFERLAAQPEVIAFFEDLYGPYPYEAAGGIMDWAPEVGYALESQTKANYSRVSSATTVVHEISHQWFGNSVTLSSWPDIWLNEGFATWSQWIYDERHGGPSAQEAFDELYALPADDEFWSPAPAALPGPEVLFSEVVYDPGAMTLQALREKLGDETFFSILRSWYRENRNGNVSTADLIELSERKSGEQLDEFFNVWLYVPEKPTSW
jgi:aminopeptidase N